MTKAMAIGGLAIVAAACCWRASAEANYAADGAAGFGAGRELVTHFQNSQNPGGPAVLTLVDPAARVLAVYHINSDSGEIKLKSVRNFSWDTQLVEFNSASPTPDEIRKGFDRQQ